MTGPTAGPTPLFAVLDADIVITGPGVYDGVTAAEYHADPVDGGSLTSSGARLLLAKSPAHYRQQVDHPDPARSRRHFDVGTAAHSKVLGAGATAVPVATNNGRWDTAAIKAEVAAVRAAGMVPVKPEEYAAVEAMAEALLANRYAELLFAAGRPEQCLVWTDPATGIMCRALLDWLPDHVPGWPLVIPDYKTAEDASPAAVRKAMWEYGRHVQGRWYRDGVEALGLDGGEGTGFLLVVQEKTPPYVVTVVEPDAEAMRWAGRQVRRARRIYADCTASGRWPDYTDGAIVQAALPRYAIYDLDDAAARGDLDYD